MTPRDRRLRHLAIVTLACLGWAVVIGVAAGAHAVAVHAGVWAAWCPVFGSITR